MKVLVAWELALGGCAFVLLGGSRILSTVIVEEVSPGRCGLGVVVEKCRPAHAFGGRGRTRVLKYEQ
jgi:hypothetical protein